jgi:hypothetical protein
MKDAVIRIRIPSEFKEKFVKHVKEFRPDMTMTDYITNAVADRMMIEKHNQKLEKIGNTLNM